MLGKRIWSVSLLLQKFEVAEKTNGEAAEGAAEAAGEEQNGGEEDDAAKEPEPVPAAEAPSEDIDD